MNIWLFFLGLAIVAASFGVIFILRRLAPGASMAALGAIVCVLSAFHFENLNSVDLKTFGSELKLEQQHSLESLAVTDTGPMQQKIHEIENQLKAQKDV